jgi:hypothetical protein
MAFGVPNQRDAPVIGQRMPTIRELVETAEDALNER